MSSDNGDQRAALLKLLVPEAAPLFAEQYGELREWAHGSLDAYRAELVRALYPFFCRCYVGLVQCGGRAAASGRAESRGGAMWRGRSGRGADPGLARSDDHGGGAGGLG